MKILIRYLIIVLFLSITSLAFADIGWYECEYKRLPNSGGIAFRTCGMNDYTKDIYGEGGEWTETEVGNNRCIVKVRASKETLKKITTCEKLKDKADAERVWTARYEPYYDKDTDTIEFDLSKPKNTKSIDSIDKKVKSAATINNN